MSDRIDKWYEENRDKFVFPEKSKLPLYNYHATVDPIAMLRAYDAEMKAAAQQDTARLVRLVTILRASVSCENLHHDKKQRHAWDEPCPVLASIDAAMVAATAPQSHRCAHHKETGPIQGCSCCHVANVLNADDGLPQWVSDQKEQQK